MDKKMWYIYTIEYYSPKKREWSNVIAAKWMSLEIIVLSGNKSEKDKYYMISTYTWNKKNNTDEAVYKAETDSQTQKTNLRLPKGKGGRDKLGLWG